MLEIVLVKKMLIFVQHHLLVFLVNRCILRNLINKKMKRLLFKLEFALGGAERTFV